MRCGRRWGIQKGTVDQGLCDVDNNVDVDVHVWYPFSSCPCRMGHRAKTNRRVEQEAVTRWS